jgi:hypothetical protein
MNAKKLLIIICLLVVALFCIAADRPETQLSSKVKALEERVATLEANVSHLQQRIQKTTLKQPTKPIIYDSPMVADNPRERIFNDHPHLRVLNDYERLHGPRVWRDGTWADEDEVHYPEKK